MRLWLIGMILAALLTACGGDSSEEQALPTRVVIGEATAEVTEDPTPFEEATEDPTPTEEVTAPVVAPVDETPEVTDSVAPPPPPISPPPVAETTQEANVAPPPITEGENMPGFAPGASSAVDDFSTLSEGDVVLLRGMVSVEDDMAFIEDEAGERVALRVPVAMTQGMVDQTIEVSGEVVAGDSGLELIVNAMNVAGTTPDIPAPLQQSPETTAQAPFPGGPPPLPGNAGEPLDIELDAGLTLLETYDALVPQLELNEQTVWTRASGSLNAGWMFDFFDQEDETQTRYTVNAEGEVSRLVVATGTPIPGMEMPPIDREQIVVDSDDVLTQIDADETTPFGAPPLTLTATEDGEINWMVQSPTGETFDATTPLE